MNGFWNAVANIGQGGAGAILAIIVIFYFQKKTPSYTNGNGHQRNMPPTICPLGTPEASELQLFKISEKVGDILVPHMEKQTQVFEEIRDALRNLR